MFSAGTVFRKKNVFFLFIRILKSLGESTIFLTQHAFPEYNNNHFLGKFVGRTLFETREPVFITSLTSIVFC